MKIYLTRHGQTDWNKQHLMQGRSDLPLNETGRLQAGEIRRKLEGISFDAVYASCLKRAVTTASLISGYPEEGTHGSTKWTSAPVRENAMDKWGFPQCFTGCFRNSFRRLSGWRMWLP